MKTPRIADFDPDATARGLKSPLEGMPVIEQPNRVKKSPSLETAEQPVGEEPPGRDEIQPKPQKNLEPRNPKVPVGVPPPVRGTAPRTPKVRRAIRQRQPFDIFEDQYLRLKQIADAEREFVDGRGMSQMVREAIDMYLKEHFPSAE
jgi:hypothetical protein